ncbi:hypothetical protein EI42_02225 [Thermosporothrix hazakensis]|jgi:hypothetical protein|uniref:Uncharacterized protein n=1 Tax=Thermosporothrix hazakensis TaxID=644383 RepID=A0A326U7S0_THEHA|nr:hypothetical protein [Thermosporothrix hazakensis]PZW31128.1 hypothetical protein EI42_02225 [Thermosporothrix hazakensis]GCE50959.1 hypothetical protein KTH_58280 [Thermosporothrix hazakensis]
MTGYFAAGAGVLEILFFGLSLWLGTYLFSRNVKSTRVGLVGAALISYALAAGCMYLEPIAPFSHAILAVPAQLLLLLPSLLCAAMLICTRVENLFGVARQAFFSGLGVLGWFVACGGIFFFLHPLIALGAALLPLVAALVLCWRHLRDKQPLLFVLLALICTSAFLAVSWPLACLPMGINLLMLGWLVAAQDAVEQGEAFLPDVFRSFDYSLLLALLFGGQVALLFWIGEKVEFPLALLLLSIIATSILVQVFSRSARKIAERIAFSTFPQVREARAELHDAADALPRINQQIDILNTDSEEFVRLTRRALSNFGDLQRLASSPLTRLPQVQERLAARGAKDDVLERATELKALLSESIERLKPRAKGDFGTSDEWRYYNALYFPYVMGIKPYSRRGSSDPPDPTTREALEWFRLQVPERTLYNWQNKAARLIAADLRNQCKLLLPEAAREAG